MASDSLIRISLAVISPLAGLPFIVNVPTANRCRARRLLDSETSFNSPLAKAKTWSSVLALFPPSRRSSSNRKRIPRRLVSCHKVFVTKETNCSNASSRHDDCSVFVARDIAASFLHFSFSIFLNSAFCCIVDGSVFQNEHIFLRIWYFDSDLHRDTKLILIRAFRETKDWCCKNSR